MDKKNVEITSNEEIIFVSSGEEAQDFDIESMFETKEEPETILLEPNKTNNKIATLYLAIKPNKNKTAYLLKIINIKIMLKTINDIEYKKYHIEAMVSPADLIQLDVFNNNRIFHFGLEDENNNYVKIKSGRIAEPNIELTEAGEYKIYFNIGY